MPIASPYLYLHTQGLEAAAIPNRALIMGQFRRRIIRAEGRRRQSGANDRKAVRPPEPWRPAGAAQRLVLDRLLSFDMGGTTAKACLIEDRKPLVAGAFEVDRIYRFMEGSGVFADHPHSIDMIEIRAGGGSIAGVNDLGLMKAGPRSAGSHARPGLLRQGGVEPTVTDADLVLGLLAPDNFLGGDMRLDEPAARSALARLGERLGVDAVQTAAGVYRIVAETMAGAARAHATDRGIDYRGLALLAFGGAGPVHACAVGALLDSTEVIFPPQASVLSAFGALVTPVRLDLVRGALGALAALDWGEVDRLLTEMSDEGFAALGDAGCAARGASPRQFPAPTCVTSASRTNSPLSSTPTRGPAATSR